MKKNKFSKIILISILFLVFTGLFLSPVKVVNGQEDSAAQRVLNGLNSSASNAQLENPNLPTMIGKIVGVALSFVGVIFLVLMIAGGIIWMVSNGNEEKVGKAKNLIVAAIIGLIVVLAAYALTITIGNVLT